VKTGDYTLTVEDAGARCAYAKVKLRVDGDAVKGDRIGVVYSEAFSGGEVSLSDRHYRNDGESTPLPEGEYEARAYLSRPVGDYTAVVRGVDGHDVATARFRVTRTAQGGQRSTFPYVTEPSIFVDGTAAPGGQVKVAVLDDGPDLAEKTVTAASVAFERPVRLTFVGRAYEGMAAIRKDAKPGRYEISVANHFGCGQVEGAVEVGG